MLFNSLPMVNDKIDKVPRSTPLIANLHPLTIGWGIEETLNAKLVPNRL